MDMFGVAKPNSKKHSCATNQQQIQSQPVQRTPLEAKTKTTLHIIKPHGT